MKLTMARVRAKVAAVVGGAIVAAGTAFGAAPAAAATDPNGAEDLITQFTNEVVGGPTLLVPATGLLIEPAMLRAVEQVVDATGKLLATRPSQMVASADSGGLDSFPCVLEGGSRRLVIFPVDNRILSGRAGFVHFQYHPYMLLNARRFNSGERNQVEVCTTGGGNLRGGWRLLQVGTGMAVSDPNQTLKIGQKWQTGSTPKDYSLSLGFQVAPKDSPISVSASLTQTPTDKLMGSMLGPVRSNVDNYPQNAVQAWWQDSCVDSWHGCHFRWNGSANFQGSLAQGLWEYPADRMPSLIPMYFAAYAKPLCVHSFGSC